MQPREERTEPENVVGPVFSDRYVKLAEAAIPIGFENCKFLGSRVKSVQTVLGPDPQRACVIEEHAVNQIAAQTGGISVRVPEDFEASASVKPN
jgi:hypothetical protein